jgi:peroxiredoxin
MRALLLSLIATLGFSTTALAMPAVGKEAPDFSVTDIHGKEVKLSDLKGKIVVLEWNNPGCPFVKKFYGSGEMQKLQADMKNKGVTWISINSGAEGKQGYMSADEAKTYVADQKSVTDHYILDSQGAVGNLYAAKTTPHMFVIDANGNVAYMGAIDDKPTPNPADLAAAKNYVRMAVQSLVDGKPVETASTQSYGCGVKYKD